MFAIFKVEEALEEHDSNAQKEHYEEIKDVVFVMILIQSDQMSQDFFGKWKRLEASD